ncbi:MAG TPA: hypothetical protein VIW68_11110 [Candidatus Sulfotelmatobacter sp.]
MTFVICGLDVPVVTMFLGAGASVPWRLRVRKALALFAVSAMLFAASAYYGEALLKRKELLLVRQQVQRLHDAKAHGGEARDPEAGDGQLHDTQAHDAQSHDAQAAAEAQQLVTITGPLAQWSQNGKPETQEVSEKQASPAEQRVGYPPHPSDHIAPAASTSNGVVVHQTISVPSDQNLSFEIPPHIMRPRLHGSYRTFLSRAGTQSGDENTSVDFILMNEQQYAAFLSGRPGDGLFVADEAHDQTIHFDLPPTMARPVKYYLVFHSTGGTEKIVEVDFQVDF